MCLPFNRKLQSLIRRFERFVADNRIDVGIFFKPFVIAMIHALGNETAYLIIDCTKAGRKCRTIFIGLAYHGTIIPIAWYTIKGKKGHVKGKFQEELLAKAYEMFKYHHRIVVLGDAEFSNETVISSLKLKELGFVFRFQSNYLIQLEKDGPWLSAREIFEASGMKPGEVRHFKVFAYTEAHIIPGLTMTIHWGEDEEEPLFLISYLNADEQPHLIYKMRFWVETLFGNYKSRGFQLARTQMVTPEHIDRLVLGIAIATCFILGLGTELIITEQPDLVDRADRRDLSLFQLGWRWLHRLIALDRLDELKILFRWDFKLSPPGFQPKT